MSGPESCCNKCGQAITGKAMKAKDDIYHEDNCFCCTVCSRDLKAATVFSKDHKLFCEKHYKENFVPKCAKCSDYITEVREDLCGRRKYRKLVLSGTKNVLMVPKEAL